MAVSDLWLDASKMQIKVGGVVQTILAGTTSISQTIGARSTCKFTVIDVTGVLSFQQGQPVEIMSSTDPTTGQRLFAGVVMTAKRYNTGWNATMLHEIACVDWHYLADKRIAATTYASQTAGFVANDLLANYLAAEGVLGIRTSPAFTRASVAYYASGTDLPVVSQALSGVARYETGAIAGSKAIRIEEGATNLLTANQSNVETNTTGFSAASSTLLSAGATITRDTTHSYDGAASLKIVTTSGSSGQGAEANITSASANTKYAASVWLFGTATQVWTVAIRDFTNSVLATINVTLVAGWQRVTITITTGGSAVTDMRMCVKTNAAVAQTVWADGWQIEAKGYATTWQVGGTARAAETLKLPAYGAISGYQGTIEFRAYMDSTVKRQIAGSFQHLFGINKSGGGGAIRIYHSSNSANWTLEITDDTGTTSSALFADSLTPDGWNRIGVAWDATSALVYVGASSTPVATITNPHLPTMLAATWYLGADGAGFSWANTLYQDVRVSSRKRTAAEFAVLTGQFAISDVDTAYLAQFDNSLAASSPNIADGPTVSSFLVNYVPVSKALDDLASLAGCTWQIDANKLLRFQPASAYPAPWTYDGTMGLDVDYGQAVEETNPLYRNGQWILGIPDVTTTQVETRKGDGANQVFPMSYPLHATPTITVNAVSKTVGIGQVDIGKDWYWNKGKNEVFQDSAGTKLISTDTLSVTYVGEWTSNVYAQDSGAVVAEQMIEGAGTGIVEEAHNEPAISTVAQGFALAASLLARYAQIGRTLEFTTRQSGLAPQQLLPISLPSQWGMAGVSALIESIEITENGTWWLFAVKAIIGPVNNDWIQYIQRSYNPLGLDVGSAGSGSTVAILQPETAAWNWAATYSATVTSCPVFPVTLSPATLC